MPAFRALAVLRAPAGRRGSSGSGRTLTAAVLGFFMVTLDAVIVNVALPSIRVSLGGGMTGSQWVVDGYTLMFAALLLSAGALSDRIGARRAFRAGLTMFAVASAACAFAPDLWTLTGARVAQGVAAAVMMPSSMALVSQAHKSPARRARALSVWAMGAALATSAGPLLGGALTLESWRLIFIINVPVTAAALAFLTRAAPSPRRMVPFDWAGQAAGALAMGGLTYGAIEVGDHGFTAPRVLAAFAVAVAALIVFFGTQARGAHPMMPLELFRSRTVSVSVAVGFAFVVGFYGLPFVMSMYLQTQRGLSPLAAGLVFLPMMLIGTILTPFGARFAERLGAPFVVTTGLGAMAASLAILSVAVQSPAPVWQLSFVMALAGLAGPMVTSPMTGALMNAVPQPHAGTASGLFNTSRQVGGALAVAVFGAMLGKHGAFTDGLRASLLIAAVVALGAASACLLLKSGTLPAGVTIPPPRGEHARPAAPPHPAAEHAQGSLTTLLRGRRSINSLRHASPRHH